MFHYVINNSYIHTIWANGSQVAYKLNNSIRPSICPSIHHKLFIVFSFIVHPHSFFMYILAIPCRHSCLFLGSRFDTCGELIFPLVTPYTNRSTGRARDLVGCWPVDQFKHYLFLSTTLFSKHNRYSTNGLEIWQSLSPCCWWDLFFFFVEAKLWIRVKAWEGTINNQLFHMDC